MRASPPFSATAGWRTSRCPRLMTLSPNGATRATAGSSRRPPSWRTHRYWPAGWNWWTPRAPVRSTRTTPPRRKRSLSPWTRRCSCSPPTPPVSASERELMARVAELSVTMFVVLNKADYLVGYDTTRGSLAEFSVAGAGDRGMDRAGGSGLGCAGANGGSELGEALEFTARVAGEAIGRAARVYPMSARAALSGRGDPGFAVFARDFTAYLERGRAADLRLSVTGHARRLAERLADEVALARRAAQMRTGEAAQRVGAGGPARGACRGSGRDLAATAGAAAGTGPGPARCPAHQRPSVRTGRGARRSRRAAGPDPGCAGLARTRAARPPAWFRSRSGGHGRICNTGWPRRPGGWCGPSGPAMPTARDGWKTRCEPRPPRGKPRPATRPGLTVSLPDGRRHSITCSACWTGPPRPILTPAARTLPSRADPVTLWSWQKAGKGGWCCSGMPSPPGP